MLSFIKIFSLTPFVLLWLAIESTDAYAQITVNNTQTVQQLVEDVLLGEGVWVSNIQFTGQQDAIGFFDGTNSNIGLDSGLLMTTGSINYAPGPNNKTNAGQHNGLSGDSDLDVLGQQTNPYASDYQTYDATILEFDFFTSSNVVTFRYVFGSEEYSEYVCTKWNDVFGFFISGPGFSGPENIALVPGTSTPVAINSINNGNPTDPTCSASNSAYFIDNETPPGTTVQYDGFTTVLEAVANIVPCQTYHIKLAIADGYDYGYDSGVFLEAQSFNAGVSVGMGSMTFGASSDTSIYESCGEASFIFKRDGDTSISETVYLNIEGTATNGVDYVLIPDSIVFLPGEDSVSVPVIAINDGVSESYEYISIALQTNSCVGSGSNLSALSLYFTDVNPISLSVSNDTTLSCPDSIVLSATANDGIGGYIYYWDGLDSSNLQKVLPGETTTYYVLATDSCKLTYAYDSVTVYIPGYDSLKALLPNDTNICYGNNLLIAPEVKGGKAPFSYVWGNVDSDMGDSAIVSPTTYHLYALSVTDSCGITYTDSMEVTALSLVSSFSYEFENNFTVDLNLNEPDVNIVYWNLGNGDTLYANNITYTYSNSGEYNIEMVSQNDMGCTDTLVQKIMVYPEFEAFIPNAFSPNNDGRNESFSPVVNILDEYQIHIFNRWGKLVFFSNDIEYAWDGTYNGNPCLTGAYTYTLVFKDIYGNYITRSGSVVLIR